MKRKLTNNLLLKIFSVIAAVLLWGVVINIDNPTDTFTITGIPIKVLHEKEAITDNDLTYEFPAERTVSVEVTARRTDKRKISADDFEATVDLNEIYGATGSVAVNIEVINHKSLIRSWTQITRSVRVDVESMQTKTFTVQVIPVGDLEDTYTFSETRVSPRVVRVTAPESVMSKIDHAGIMVDVSGAVDNVQETGTIKLYTDEASEHELDMTDPRIELNVTEAEVALEVVKTNRISVDVQVTGQDQVAEGHKYITYICEPQTVLVTGAKALIADFDKVTVKEDLTGVSGNITKIYRIQDYLPKGLEVADGQPDSIEVTYQIDRLAQRSFYIGKNLIQLQGMSEELEYRIGDDDGVTVTLEGLSEDLERIENKDMFVLLNMEEYKEPGVYSCQPEVELAEEYQSYFKISVGTIRVIITKPNSEPDTSEGNPSESSTTESGEMEETGESAGEVSGTLPSSSEDISTEEAP